ncbi:putative ABC transporter ATPase and permease protein [Actinoplanes missouriensis 431]|uniref:Putative ABC transporter ATPase and permease protein n=1 Tax=Actinoplanes missouriensis (strain ATCC 14538 / DSM 43046 / CBS 188.64 / JCM 3121 / NBRC 102363 / NCIMB 12654 / NRRL B-3342 / UNCC 431) TaxID=512565 RepID=I0H4G5_ACTM4|nr:ABC transporter ATP-binding protein [Actinoplanes missouriensis]BAL87902.1 putative ABC transporter ATPase and permease protein [Actinoplanes missouriensis 431]
MSSPRRSRGGNLALLASFVRPHRRRLLAGLLLGLGVAASALATPLVTKMILDSVSTSASLTAPVAALLGLLVLGVVLGYAQATLLGTVAENVVLDVRTSLVRRFFRGRLPDLQRRSSGELVSRVVADTVLLREASSTSLVNLINGAVSLTGTIVLMAVLDVPLLGVTLAAVTVVGLLVAALMRPIAEAQSRAQDEIGKLGGVLAAGLDAVRTVKADGAEDRQTQRVVMHAEASARHSIKAVRTEAAAWSAADGGIQLAIIAILAFGAWRVSTGDLPVSTLIAFLLYAFGLVAPVSEITLNVTQLQAGIAAAARIRDAESIRTELLDAGAPVPAADAATAGLSFTDVTMTYPGSAHPALTGFTADIPGRGHTALVGPSGSGKTTVFSLLLRFYDPDTGVIRLNGADHRTLSIAAVRHHIAYVQQETPLLPGSIRDNIAFRSPDTDDQIIWQALDAVGLADHVRKLPAGLAEPAAQAGLSGGQRQRVALARAIVTRPAILLLDEATSQLDGLTEAAVQRIITDLAQHSAVITIAHRLSTVIDADTILLMEKGTVRAAGTHRDLLTRDDLYRDLVAALRIGS